MNKLFNVYPVEHERGTIYSITGPKTLIVCTPQRLFWNVQMSIFKHSYHLRWIPHITHHWNEELDDRTEKFFDVLTRRHVYFERKGIHGDGEEHGDVVKYSNIDAAEHSMHMDYEWADGPLP